MKILSFLVPNPLNNQSDFLFFFSRQDFVQVKLDHRFFLNIVDETLDYSVIVL